MDIDWSKAPEGATHALTPGKEWNGDKSLIGTIEFAILRDGDYFEAIDKGGRYCMGERSWVVAQKRPQVWSGEGLPPVGIACEVKNSINGGYDEVEEVLAHTEINCSHVAVFKRNGGVFYSQADQFRPLRTPEQIAAEEREDAISQMAIDALKGAGSLINKEWLSNLHDAGYRKQEQPK